MKSLFLFSITVFFANISFAQNESFQQTLNDSLLHFRTVVGENGNIVATYRDLFSNNTDQGLYIIKDYDSSSSSQNAIKTEPIINSPFSWLNSHIELINNRELFIYAHNFGSNFRGVLYWNLETDQNWFTDIQDVGSSFNTPAIVMDANSNVYFFYMSYLSNSVYYIKLNTAGEILFKRHFHFNLGGSQGLNSIDAVYSNITNSIFIASSRGFTNKSFFVEFDTAGVILNEKYLNEDVGVTELLQDDNGNLYAIGATSMLDSITENEADLFAMKLDSQFNTLWSNVYYADDFSYDNATFNITDDQSLAIAYSTNEDSPVILSQVDSDGNILWEKGYPFYRPEINVFNDGSLLLTTSRHFNENGALSLKNIIAKTDSFGDIEDCPVFPSCLNSMPITLSSGIIHCFQFDIPLQQEITSFPFTNTQLSASDFCDIPPSPRPEFELPDTICIGTCVEATNLPNHFSHGLEWELSGIFVDSTWQDSLTFAHCFEEAGDFWVTQTVWFLGCDHSFTEKVVVLKEFEAEIETVEGNICFPPPLILGVTANLPIRSFEWESGEINATEIISESGEYRVTVSNGFCETTAEIQLNFASDNLDLASVLTLSNDTTICEQHFPFTLSPQSLYSDKFLSQGKEQDFFELNEIGNYKIEVEIGDCVYEDFFQLKTKNCAATIFFPNIFSPNSDGINDFFFPQGLGFELIEMQIFDRWGSLIFETKDINQKWRGKNLPMGVYLFKTKYLNLLSGEKEEILGDVLLIK